MFGGFYCNVTKTEFLENSTGLLPIRASLSYTHTLRVEPVSTAAVTLAARSNLWKEGMDWVENRADDIVGRL